MRFHFYSRDDFLMRAKHLNMHRIKNEPIKIGKYFYNYISHTLENIGDSSIYVIVLSEPVRVERKDYPEKYCDIHNIY